MFRANVKLVLDPGAGARIVDEASKRSVSLSPTEGRILALLMPGTTTAVELHAAAAGAGIEVELAQIEALLSRLQSNELLDYSPSTAKPGEKMMLPDDIVPAFRSDLGVAPTEKGLVKVTDRKKNRSFTIYDFELHIARLLDGSHKVSEVIERAGKIGIPVTPESLTKFISQMRAYGFIKAPAMVPAATPGDDATWGSRATWSPEIREMFQSAMRQFRSGRPGHALEYLNALLSIQPDTPEAIELKERVLKHEQSGPVHEVGFEDLHGEGVPELVAASEPLSSSSYQAIPDPAKPSLTKSTPKFTPSKPVEEPKPSLTKSTPKYTPSTTLSTPKYEPPKPLEEEAKPKATTLSTPKYVPPADAKPVSSLFDPAPMVLAKPSPPKPKPSTGSSPRFDPAAEVQAKPSPPKPKPSSPSSLFSKPSPPKPAQPPPPDPSPPPPPAPLSPLSPLADSRTSDSSQSLPKVALGRMTAPKPSAPRQSVLPPLEPEPATVLEIAPPTIDPVPEPPPPEHQPVVDNLSATLPPLSEPGTPEVPAPVQPKIEPAVVVRDSYLEFAKVPGLQQPPEGSLAAEASAELSSEASAKPAGKSSKGLIIGVVAALLVIGLLIPIPSTARLDVELENSVLGTPKSPAGVLAEMKVQNGAHVDEGAVLATLDTSKLKAEVDEVQKALAKLESQAKLYASNTKPESVRKAKAALAKAEGALASAKSEADKKKKEKDVDRCKRILAVTDGVEKARQMREGGAPQREKLAALQAQMEKATITAPKSGVFQIDEMPAAGAQLAESAAFGRIVSGLMLIKGAPSDASDAVLIKGDQRVQLFAVDKKPEGLTVSFETGLKPGPAKLELARGLRPWPLTLAGK